MPETKPKKNTLNQSQNYQLMRWLDEHREELQGAALTKDQVAAKAQKELKFMLTWSNIRTALASLGIKLATERAGAGGGPLQARLNRVERILEALCRKLGTEELLSETNGTPAATLFDKAAGDA